LQELFLGGELGLALGSDLAHEDVARLHLCADAHDAGVVEVLERLFAGVGDVAGDLFAPSFTSRAMTSNSSMCIEV
jgi:hypothetical protein